MSYCNHCDNTPKIAYIQAFLGVIDCQAEIIKRQRAEIEHITELKLYSRRKLESDNAEMLALLKEWGRITVSHATDTLYERTRELVNKVELTMKKPLVNKIL